MNQRWRLMTGDTLVGTIDVTGTDQPWLTGHFHAEPSFAEYGDLFARELALVEGDLDKHMAQWEEIYGRIQNRLRLLKPDGTAVPEYLLHIRNSDAWFRYSDEAFQPSEGQQRR
jgi:hypothetical protein